MRKPSIFAGVNDSYAPQSDQTVENVSILFRSDVRLFIGLELGL